MGMVVRTNTMALNAYRQLGMNNSAVSKSLEKLSSGFRINRAGDDAAGLAISEKMKAQITGLETASANAQDGISLIQTAEGNLSEVHDMLNRMVELATKSANGTYTATERDALQAEVDQLLDEIDRISQSANFNGAKLLDGTMGLNTGAFTKFSDMAATKAHDGNLVGADFVAKEADGTPKVHLENASSTAVAPGVTIDLGKLKVHVAQGETAKVTFNIAGQDITADLNNASGTDAEGKDFEAKDIAAALLTALKTHKSADGTEATTGADAIRIGNAVYTLEQTANTAKIKLNYAGAFYADGKTYRKETKFSGDAAEAEAINNSLGFKVSVKDVKSGTQIDGTDVVHMATTVKRASAKANASLAGIDIDLTKIVGQGNTLTIDGVTYTFQTEKDNVPKDEDGNDVAASDDPAKSTLIDVSSAETFEEAVHMAADKLSNLTPAGVDKNGAATDRTWKIGVNENGTTIHIDQVAAHKDAKEVLDTYEKLTSILSAKVAPTAEANVATKIDVDATKIVAGDAIRVDGKAYTFGDGEGKIAIGENGADALANLKKALEADGYKAEIAKDGKSITVQAKDAKAEAGPAVTGGGLTIQIGDTADSFNKMNISVENMSSKGLGLSGLDITSETKASNAIDKIKTAINSVSSTRANMGALQNRLEHTINNLDVAVENLSAANSRIRDTDMAKEMMNYTKMNVLVQSAQAMLAQANQQPQSVLQLLQ